MRASLTVERGDAEPAMLEFDPNREIILGRSRDSDIILRDELVSRHHAKILFQDFQWRLQDLGTTNGTKIGEERIEKPAILKNGQAINIGDMRLRFAILEPVANSDAGFLGTLESSHRQVGSDCATMLQADELAVLHGFVNGCFGDNEPQSLIRRLLELVHRQTRADLVGFLSCDPENPQPRLIVPESSAVNLAISRQLNGLVQQLRQTVWLAQQRDEMAKTESLERYQDALCVPLLGDGLPFGALHVYKTGRRLAQRDMHFCEVAAGYAANSLARLRYCRRLAAENRRLRRQGARPEELLGNSPAMAALGKLIQRAAACDATVLIHGESGAGKEPVAAAIHDLSRRRSGSFVVCNCAAIAPNLLESELFGHDPGSFTGAVAKHEGLFEQADQGTLFLDEIGDMSPECQVKVLRAIEGRPFRRVGGKEDVYTSARIIAATHKDLEEQVRKGKFRHDLYYRLNILCICVPPLRDHREDIPLLASRFLEHLAAENGTRPKRLSPAALQKLQDFAWPGNVRQLRGVLAKVSVMCDGEVIEESDLGLSDASRSDQPDTLNLDKLTAWAIRKALARTKWQRTKTAKLLGITRETLRAKMNRYGIKRALN
jgi:DNA-binding NtrC family response regulator